MQVTFWGTRGSLPVATHGERIRWRIVEALRRAQGHTLSDDAAIERFVDSELEPVLSHGYGGNTSCVEISSGQSDYVLCDMGSGLREFGQQVMARHGPVPQRYHIFMSHVHWDHIMGFPFFTPAYIPGNDITIYGCHDLLEEALRRQHSDPCFPVSFNQLGATIRFEKLTPGQTYAIAGLNVRAILQPHHGDSYGYRFERDGRALVYSTDAEHKLDALAEIEAFIEFLHAADLVIFDAMYSLADVITIRTDWGHSSNLIGVDLCHRAGVRHLCLFHHEPACDDRMIQRVLNETIRYEEIVRPAAPLRITSAYDGLKLDV